MADKVRYRNGLAFAGSKHYRQPNFARFDFRSPLSTPCVTIWSHLFIYLTTCSKSEVQGNPSLPLASGVELYLHKSSDSFEEKIQNRELTYCYKPAKGEPADNGVGQSKA